MTAISRIVILTDDLGGGTGNHLLSMMKHWDKNRFQVEILSRAPIRSRIAPEVPVRHIPSQGRINVYPVPQVRSLFRIRRELLDRRPDIVHAYFFWPILFGRLLKMRGVIPTLIENREDQGFAWGSHEYYWLRMTRRVPDRIICVSDAVKRVVVEREGIEEERIVVIRNGVEPLPDEGKDPADVRKELGLGQDHLVVGMVANFNRSVKGVSLFLDAVPEIVREVPEARFLLLGRGNEEQTLRDKALSMGIDPYVIFAGYRQDIQRYYDIMDVSALTSFSEGLSITILESMRCGIPVVVTRVGGNPEVVVDGETGYLVPQGDVHAFAVQMVKLLKDETLRKAMGTKAREHVEKHFRLRDVALRYTGIYEEYSKEPQNHIYE